MRQIITITFVALLTFSCSEDKREIIGEWIEDSSSHRSEIVIFQKGIQIYSEAKYRGEALGANEITVVTINGEKRFVENVGDDIGKDKRFYTIDSHGNLVVYYNEEKIKTMVQKK